MLSDVSSAGDIAKETALLAKCLACHGAGGISINKRFLT